MTLLYMIFSVLCLGIGFYFGYKLADTKKLPEVNPIKIADQIKTDVEGIKKKKDTKKELNNLNQILKNMDTFDGTSKGQIPIKK